jgi:4-aminobutyrate aminotransferase/(S)-3-amino-2-methylpropionate transaminase
VEVSVSADASRNPSRLPDPPDNRSDPLFEEEQLYIAPGAQSIALNSRLVVDHGKGVFLTDVDGREFLDFFSGVTVGSLGHSHPKYVSALTTQLQKVTFGSFTTAPRVRFLKGLAQVAPGDLRRAHLYSGGSEAVEAALRLAKAHTKKFEFIGFWGGFHGKTGGVLGLIGDDFKHQRGPLAPGSYSVPYANCYRCPFQATHPGCSFLCVEFLRKFIRHNTSGCVAAILVEPIQGTAGNVVPPPGFLKALRDVAREAEALLITDEIITGFGRTGKMFCVEHEGIVPDIMTLGKGMGGGFPVSGLISTDEIVAAKPFSIPSASSSSYGGNPLAAAACLVTLETILEEKLVENSHAVGAWLLDQLREIEARYPFVGDVRGKGLMIGVELVRDKKTKEPLSSRATKALFQLALKERMILMITNSVIRVNPALIISQKEAALGLEKLKKIFDVMEKEKLYQE